MIVNAAIQVVPICPIETAMPIIDRAIAIIQQSGIKYTVGPFETTLEGEYDKVQEVLKKVQDFCYNEKKEQFLVYTKLHVCGGADIVADDKTAKFNAR